MSRPQNAAHDLNTEETEALIASLESAEQPNDEVIEEVVADLHIDEAKSDALASANDNEVVDDTAPETTPETAEKNQSAKRVAKPKAPKAPRFNILGKSPSEALPHTLNAPNFVDAIASLDSTILALDVDTRTEVVREMLSGMDKSAVKVKEKIINAITSLQLGKVNEVSNYTAMTIDLLIEKGEVSSADIKANFKTKYTEGTSASQAGQMMQALPLVLIAKLVGKKLVLNENSSLVSEYRRLKLAAATA
jgi:hypothetical protein